jgi:hypothetical protein
LNGDSKPDLVVSHCDADDSIALYFNDGQGKFPVSQEIELGANRDELEIEIRDVEIADFNNDGKPDLAAAGFASGQVYVLMNDTPSALPLTFTTQKYRFEGGRPRALAVADFNGDQKQDIAVALWEKNAVGLLLGR